jgi:hypothetical protein
MSLFCVAARPSILHMQDTQTAPAAHVVSSTLLLTFRPQCRQATVLCSQAFRLTLPACSLSLLLPRGPLC